MDDPALYLGTVVTVGVGAQWLAWRCRIPGILFLLLAGFALGNVADPDQILTTDVVQPIVSLAVALILFEGGLTLKLSDLRETRAVVARLITLGSLITWALASACGLLVFESIGPALLAGAIYTVTGPTVIAPLLRSVRPTRSVGSVAKWEGIVVDPIGALLAVFVFEAVAASGPKAAAEVVLWSLARTIAVSVPSAIAVAALFVYVIRKHWLPDHLENPVMFAMVLAVHTWSNAVQPEAGLATVTLLGILLANQRIVSIDHVAEFKENLTVLLIGTLFILLASRLNLAELLELGWGGLVFLALLILVVRPVSVLTALLGSSMRMRERLFLSWLAPRGIVAVAVSSVFALHAAEQVEAGTLDAAMEDEMQQLVSLTFLVVVGTVAVYGLTAGVVARRLGVSDSDPQGIVFLGANPISVALTEAVKAAGFRAKLIDTNRAHVRDARMRGLEARHGNALFESVKESLDLGGIGRLVATTPNDEVNTLAMLEYADVFSRREVYRLPTHTDHESRPAGRVLFGTGLIYEALLERFERGTVKQTKLTAEFGFEDFHRRYGESAIVLFVRQASGELDIATKDDPLVPRPGSSVIALVEGNGNASQPVVTPRPE